MRYHTAPLIAFTALLEKFRYTHPNRNTLFEEGKEFACSVNKQKIDKASSIERKYDDRYYRLSFRYFGNYYRFQLDPQSQFFNHRPEGNIIIKPGWRYELDRNKANYKEYNVEFKIHFPIGSINGTYYNWHSEPGSFAGQLFGDDRAKLTAWGKHYRRDSTSPYYTLPDNQRMTTWNFEIPFSGLTLPR